MSEYIILSTDKSTSVRNQIEARDFVRAIANKSNSQPIIFTDKEFRIAIERTRLFLGMNKYGYKSI